MNVYSMYVYTALPYFTLLYFSQSKVPLLHSKVYSILGTNSDSPPDWLPELQILHLATTHSVGLQQ